MKHDLQPSSDEITHAQGVGNAGLCMKKQMPCRNNNCNVVTEAKMNTLTLIQTLILQCSIYRKSSYTQYTHHPGCSDTFWRDLQPTNERWWMYKTNIATFQMCFRHVSDTKFDTRILRLLSDVSLGLGRSLGQTQTHPSYLKTQPG